MDELQFFLSPVGIMLLCVILATIVVVLRTTAASTRQQRQVYATLLEAAKKAAHQPITVVVPLRRRAESLEGLFAMLEAQTYEHLEVLVVIYQTAGSRAATQLRTLGRRHHLRVKTVRHTKGRQLQDFAYRRAQGSLVTVLSPDDQLTPRFFEQASYAFTQNVAALRVRTFRLLDNRLLTAFQALRTLFAEIVTHGWHQATEQEGLIDGVIVRRLALKPRHTYTVKTMLFDDFAIGRYRIASSPTFRSMGALILVVLGLCVVIALTPADLLGYVSALAGSILLITMLLFVVQHKGYRFVQKCALVLLLPFMPLYVVFALCTASVRASADAIDRKIRPLRRLPRAQQRQPIRTQS